MGQMMIGLQLEDNAFEQDVRELLMAFYPGAVFGCQDPEAEEGELRVTGRFLDGGARYALKAERKPGTERNRAEIKLSSPVLKKGLEEARENRPFPIEPDNRVETKNRIKRRLYFLLMLDTGKQLPWGALTGIRPVKIPEGKLALGWDEERISSYMEEHYLVGEEKRKLSLEIAGEERHLLAGRKVKEGYSLYVGIPFCPTTCLYCSFPSYPIEKWQERLGEYLNILGQELAIVREAVSGKPPQTIYIGGGTPTSLPEEQLGQLMEILGGTFDLGKAEEFTVEAGRPDSITRGKLNLLRDYGVGRISINPQSMNQKTLDLIGRRHTVSQVEEVFWMARELGFDNINMDIILGLPGEGEDEVGATLKAIKALGPESLTVHCLAIKRAARLNLERELYRGYPMVSGQLMDALACQAEEAARSMGMKPYYLYRQKNMAGNLENVGYAARDKACLYNIYMMEERHTVMGCGAGTTTKVVFPEENRVERLENIKNIQDYLPRFREVLEKKRKFLQQCGQCAAKEVKEA